MKVRGIGIAVGMAALGMQSAQASVHIHFDQSTYNVAPGERFPVVIVMDGDSALGGDQPLSQGLFLASLKLNFDAAMATVANVNEITPRPALHTDGIGNAPMRQVGSGFGGLSAGPNFLSELPYNGTELAQIFVTDLSPGSYTLSLAQFFSSPSMADFVDGDGNSLDGALVFETAIVNAALPEPASLAGFAVAGAGLLSRRRRRM